MAATQQAQQDVRAGPGSDRRSQDQGKQQALPTSHNLQALVMHRAADPSVVAAVACMQVMGVGGGGSNAVNRMLANQLTGVEMYVLNTDAQVSACSPGPWPLLALINSVADKQR